MFKELKIVNVDFFKQYENTLSFSISENLKKLNKKQKSFFSSLIYLIFEKIQPFNDGSDRSGRLFEMCFLSNFIEESVWMIESEKYYFENCEEYYNNLWIAFDYYRCDYNKSLPFLITSPNAIC